MNFEHFNTRLGTQTIGPRYHFTDEGALIESAKGIMEMGSDILKISLSVGAYHINTTKDYSLEELVANEPNFRFVMDMPFKYYMMWAQPKYTDESGVFDFHLDEQAERKLYEEFYNLTKHLLTTYSGTGKVFLIGHWEGDWILLKGYDYTKEAENDIIQGMIRNLSIRQKAIEDARNSIAHENVWVGHYAEVNRPLDAKLKGMKRMTNKVLPRVTLDIISYSCYDALWPNRLTEALDYIEKNARFTDYFDGIFEKKVFIGEYDGYRDYHQHGYFSPEMQVENALTVIASAISWGTPFVLYWEYYNNEHERLIHGGGFWLIDEQNEKQLIYFAHRNILAKINFWKNVYRFWLCRNPKESELNDLIGKLHEKRADLIIKEFLESEVFRFEISAQQYFEKLFGYLFRDTGNKYEKIQKWLSRVEANKSRYEILTELFDSNEFKNEINDEDFIKAMGLEKITFDINIKRSELWIYKLNRKNIMLEELKLRKESEVDFNKLARRYLFLPVSKEQ